MAIIICVMLLFIFYHILIYKFNSNINKYLSLFYKINKTTPYFSPYFWIKYAKRYHQVYLNTYNLYIVPNRFVDIKQYANDINMTYLFVKLYCTRFFKSRVSIVYTSSNSFPGKFVLTFLDVFGVLCKFECICTE